MIYVFMASYGFSRLQASLAAVFMVISQANAHAVLSNDTFSQVLGAFFGYGSLWLLYIGSVYRLPLAARSKLYLTSSLVAYAVALFSKESSISFLLIIGLIVLVPLKERLRTGGLRSALMILLPYLAVTLLYFVARGMVVPTQPQIGTSRYDFRLGINLIQNAALFMAAVTVPVSSVTAFLALKRGEIGGGSLLISLSALLFVAAVAYGIWRSDRRRLSIMLMSGSTIALLPMMLLNKVSELYVYNAMPFVAILVGIALGKLIDLSRSGLIRLGVVALVGLLVLAHANAVRQKAALMKEEGDKASALLSQILSYVDMAPVNGRLLLVNPEADQIEYSVFLVHGFKVFLNGEHIINQFSGRQDIRVKIVAMGDLSKEKPGPDALVLTLKDSDVLIYQRSP